MCISLDCIYIYIYLWDLFKDSTEIIRSVVSYYLFEEQRGTNITEKLRVRELWKPIYNFLFRVGCGSASLCGFGVWYFETTTFSRNVGHESSIDRAPCPRVTETQLHHSESQNNLATSYKPIALRFTTKNMMQAYRRQALLFLRTVTTVIEIGLCTLLQKLPQVSEVCYVMW